MSTLEHRWRPIGSHFEYAAKNGTRFIAMTSDLQNGVTARIPDGNDEVELLEDVSEFIGYHAVNILPGILSHFSGYDHIMYTVE